MTVTSLLRFIARISAPLARPLAGRRLIRLWAVLSHRGRSSGRSYSIPVAVARVPDGFVVPVPFGERTQWVKNVLAAGGCRLRWAGRDYELVDPEIVGRQSGAAAFGRILGPTSIDRFLRLRDAPA
jgi:deazaflavin-dependent oxidoreductase (nitroreductase family)